MFHENRSLGAAAVGNLLSRSVRGSGVKGSVSHILLISLDRGIPSGSKSSRFRVHSSRDSLVPVVNDAWRVHTPVNSEFAINPDQANFVD